MSSMPNAFEKVPTQDITAKFTEAMEKSFAASDSSFDLTDEQLEAVQNEVKQVPHVAASAIKVKAAIKPMTAAQFVKQAQESDAALRANLDRQGFKPNQTQVLRKSTAPIKADRQLDYRNISESDIYNDSIPIEVKPFGMEDSLKIELVDQNYAARWVNKDPRMLGKALKNGFSYITKEDLATDLDTAITEDAHGHYLNFDVIAMKCPKRIYFAALKAAHVRAVNTVSNLSSQKAARKQALDLMMKETGGGFSEEYEAGKVGFYTPGVEI